jgi:hypothetical protein
MYEFTPADPTIKRPGHETRLTDKQKILFIYIPLVAFASMMTGIVYREEQAVGLANLILGIVLNVLALLWARIDADERQYELSIFFTLAVVLFGIFAIIYYLFRSRGASGGLISTGWMILYMVGTLFALVIISTIVTFLLVAVGVLPRSILDA